MYSSIYLKIIMILIIFRNQWQYLHPNHHEGNNQFRSQIVNTMDTYVVNKLVNSNC